ncbi:MAG: yecS 1 [Firmicutes bacterium]|nr:yecS 1 [Bacillota bacterium]
MELALSSLHLLIAASAVTIGLAVAAMAIGLVIGLLAAITRVGKVPVLEQFVRGYVSLIRGTPLLVQLFMIYYGLPQLGLPLEPIPSGIIALSLNVGAYLSESFRAAILSVPKGQYEAGLSLGMSYWTVMRRIIIPQSIRTALPTIGNSFISLLKDTSLVSVITVTELLRATTLVIARTFQPLTLYAEAALIYWLLSSGFSLLQERIERRVSRHV